MGERLLAYRFALDLNQSQTETALSHVGGRRFAYNQMLAVVTANLAQRHAERSYGIPPELLTPSVDRSAFGLQKLWNAYKQEWAPWWAENSKEAYADGCRRLAAALSNWHKARRGTRKGQSGFPRFASRRGRQSVTYTTGAIRVDDRRHVVLPRLGRLRAFEDTTKLLTLVETGQARISRATLAFHRGRWFVSFTVHKHVDDHAKLHRLSRPVGIDVGVKDLLVVAGPNGRELERISAPRHLAEAQRRLRALQRKADRQVGPWDPASNRHRDPSSGWRRTQARISRAHARIANLREDTLHQATTRITRAYGNIVIEDLNVRGMTTAGGSRKRGLNRALVDASFAKLARMLAYKARWAGGTLTRADRFFPSSKTCSGCGAVKIKLLLSERTFRCEHCGHGIDRDLNAAINLARYSAGTSAGVPGRDASGANRKTGLASAGGDETGTCPGRSATP
ncbi:IS607 family element RNA-guided endonuclease TnpB [Leifsonia sp. NPDC058248]|uniref:IS607 family element RNA-guided endonuclease TnpB n=1 Tax=Leifsonia sp. NPDC058248 TaxID=3346402 RepID=UPI0036DA83B2